MGARTFWALVAAWTAGGCHLGQTDDQASGGSSPRSEDSSQSTSSPSTANPDQREQRIQKEMLARDLRDAPFLTLHIGPKSLEMNDDLRPFACRDSNGMECVVSGDADWTHRFVWVVPWKIGVYEPEPTRDDLRSWQTERGFGIGSLDNDVYEKIGSPTLSTKVDKHRVDVYRWDYGMDYGDGPYLASYQLDIVYADNKVVGIMIDISEGP